MAKHNVKVTRGSFKLVGNVSGTKGKNFFDNKVFDSGNEKNTLLFTVKTSKTNESSVKLEGFTQKTAKFNKFDKDTKKSIKEEVSWASRFDFEKDGFAPSFGTKINLTGEKNAITTLFQYDACEQLKDDLVDGMSVYVEGDTNFSSYKKGEELRKYKNLSLTKIYKQAKPIDFDDEAFVEENKFQQEFIFMGIEQELDLDTQKPTGRAIVSAKIVTSETVEDTEFVVEDKKIISNMRSKLKPYTALKVVGRLITKVEEEKVVKEKETDDWGDDEDFDDKPHNIHFKEWMITKVIVESIDTETYSESILASITQAEEDYGDFATDDGDDDVWN